MNVLNTVKKQFILHLIKQGKSHREIARIIQINRKTVPRYAKQYDLFASDDDFLKELDKSCNSVQFQSTTAKSVCKPHRKWIIEQIELNRNAMVTYQDLVDTGGFTNHYNSFQGM